MPFSPTAGTLRSLGAKVLLGRLRSAGVELQKGWAPFPDRGRPRRTSWSLDALGALQPAASRPPIATDSS
jgi:hypothetical protein